MALLPPDLLQRLSRLSLRTRKRGAGVRAGERRSIRRGQSQEFADHRPYVPGDDLRFLDWHLYGRLDALWIKLFEEEDDRVVQLLLDTSASMSGEKLDYARKVAAALAFVALGTSDRVGVAALTTEIAHYAAPQRGRRCAHGVFTLLESIHPGGETALDRAAERLPRQRGSGIALLFTDFLYPDGPDAALKRLLSRGNEVHAFHVIAPVELRPDLDGDFVMVDAENGTELDVTLDDEVLEAYQSTVLAWAEEMRATCQRLGVGYTRLLTSVPVEDVILRDLPRQGVVS